MQLAFLEDVNYGLLSYWDFKIIDFGALRWKNGVRRSLRE